MGGGRKKAKQSRVVPHPKLNPGCATGAGTGAGSLSYIVHVDFCGLSTIVIKKIIIIIIITQL